MTIKYPDRFRQAAPAGFDGVFDWDFLLPAFAPTKIQPMDLDAVVERRGHFIVFETKDHGAPVPEGQRITLERLVQTGVFTIVVTRGKTSAAIQGWDSWWFNREVRKTWHSGDAAALCTFVKRWFAAPAEFAAHLESANGNLDPTEAPGRPGSAREAIKTNQVSFFITGDRPP